MFSRIIEKLLGKKTIQTSTPKPITDSLNASSNRKVVSGTSTSTISTSLNVQNKAKSQNLTRTFDLNEYMERNSKENFNKPQKQEHDENLNKESVLHNNANINPFCVPQQILDLVPDTIVSNCEILPVNAEGNIIDFYYASVSQKQKAEKMLATSNLSKYSFKWELVSQDCLSQFLKANYGKSSFQDKAAKVVDANVAIVKKEFTDIKEKVVMFDFSGEISGDENNRVKNIIGSLIYKAVVKGATDIDFDNNQALLANGKIRSELLVSARINGRMHVIWREEMGKKAFDAFPSVVKTLASLDSTNHKSSDSGIIRATVRKGKDLIPVELRAQFMPSGGDKGIGISIRVQTKFGFSFSLENIGLTRHQLEILNSKVVNGVKGVVFITGSVNRGKNCTLVSLLEAIKKAHSHKNVVLVEDTIEFILNNIRQIQIPHGKTHHDMQKPLLRYNPDIIAFGETRDEMATQTVMDLSAVGHQILTTLHANTACEVAERLVDLGIPRYKIANSLKVCVSQILVRKTCHNCIKECDYTFEKVERFGSYLESLGYDANTQLYRATGKLADGSVCPECDGEGYCGRTGVFEVLVVSENIRQLILKENTTTLEIKRQALEEGFQTLWMNGLMKVLNGETTISELLEHIEMPSSQSEGLDLNLQFQDSILEELSN